MLLSGTGQTYSLAPQFAASSSVSFVPRTTHQPRILQPKSEFLRGTRRTIVRNKVDSYHQYVARTYRGEATTSPGLTTYWGQYQRAMRTQEATSSIRKKFHCPRCNSGYTRLADMKTHCQFQCGKEPRYQCPYCTKKAKFSSNMYVHVRRMHKEEKLLIIDLHKQ